MAQGQIAAIALTYDDALRSQLDIAIPQLDAAGFKGTFFLDGDITPADMLRWREAQRAGHELGNHSLFHPCPRAMLPDRKNYFTENYDVDRMLGEIAAMNNVLFGIDGAKHAHLFRAVQPDARGRRRLHRRAARDPAS